MKILFVLALVALPVWAAAQQSMLDPATSNQTLDIEALELLPSGDIVSAGFAGDNAHLCRTIPSGTVTWSKTCNSNSVLYGFASMSDGNFIAVGNQAIDPSGSSGLVIKFGPAGNIIWQRTFSVGDSTVIFRSVVVDPTGRIHVLGDKSKSSNRCRILIGLDPNGNFLCGTQIQSSGTTFFGRRLFIWEDHLYAFGESRSSGKGIGMTKFTLNDTFVSETVFGGFGPNDNFLDAIQYQDKFVFSYWNANIPGTIMLARVNTDMEIEGSPVSINPGMADFWSLSLGNLGVGNAGEVYVSGAMAGNGFNSAFVLKTDVNLSPFWAKKLLYGSLPTKTASAKVSGGGVVVATTRNNNTPFANAGVTVTKLSAAGEATALGYCHQPEPFGFEFWSEGLPVYPQTRNPIPLALSPGGAAFSAYAPLVLPCGATLPVEMLSFTGKQIDETVELAWNTGSESNNDHFDILRSTDEGQTWDAIGQVAGAGNSAALSQYGFTDADPVSGRNYYRLLQVDHDGTTNESETIAIEFASASGNTLVLSPNPLPRGEELQGLNGQRFEVLSLAGQVVRSSSFDTNLGQLPAGTYVIRITDTNAWARVIVN